MSLFEAENLRIADQVDRLAKRLRLSPKNAAILGTASWALRSAVDALLEAHSFALAAADPNLLLPEWASGEKPYDPVAAMDILAREAAMLEWILANELFEFDPRTGEPLGENTDPLPSFVYVVGTGGYYVAVESSDDLSAEEACARALPRFVHTRVGLGQIMSVTKLGRGFDCDDTIYVLTARQLDKAGFLEKQGGEV
jgi:hypothetical protein